MSDPGPLDWRARPAGSDRALILLKVVACFALLGPPLGALVFFALISAAIGRMGADPGGPLAVFGFLSLFGLPLSYLVGAMPAALTGAVVGLWQAFRGRMSFPFAAAVGLGCGLIVAGAGRWQVYDLDPGQRADLALILLTCLIPTLICWYVTRNAAIGPRPESP